MFFFFFFLFFSHPLEAIAVRFWIHQPSTGHIHICMQRPLLFRTQPPCKLQLNDYNFLLPASLMARSKSCQSCPTMKDRLDTAIFFSFFSSFSSPLVFLSPPPSSSPSSDYTACLFWSLMAHWWITASRDAWALLDGLFPVALISRTGGDATFLPLLLSPSASLHTHTFTVYPIIYIRYIG